MQQNADQPSSGGSRLQSTEKPLFEGRWSPQEHIQFLRAVLVHGKDWKKVEEVIESRTGSQVRSHAQKFFLKISKINKQRRRHKNKPFQLSETQAEILNLFTEQDVTDNSPSEIVSIIKKEFNTTAQKAGNKGKQMQHKRKFSDNSDERPEDEPQDSGKIKIPEKQTGQFSKILQNLKRTEDIRQQDESFFIKLLQLISQNSKKNMEHFKNGGQFSDLIDFGKNVTQCQQTSPRKLSVLDPNDYQNNTK